MKKVLIVVITVVMALSVASCAKKAVEIDLLALKNELLAADLFLDEFEQINDSKIETMIGLDLTLIVKGEFWRGSGVTGEEYGLFECKDEKDAKALVKLLEERREYQYTTYEGYAKEALPRIENTVIRQSGKYVAYVAADKYEKAAEIVDKAFGK